MTHKCRSNIHGELNSSHLIARRIQINGIHSAESVFLKYFVAG